VPPGFQPDHLLIAGLPLSQTAYTRPEQRYSFYDRVVDRTKTLPGVRSAAAASFLPVSGGGGLIHFNITGRPPKSPHDFIAAGYRTVTSGYFETLGVPLLRGRWIAPGDVEKAPWIVVINNTMAHTFFPNDDPLRNPLHLDAFPPD